MKKKTETVRVISDVRIEYDTEEAKEEAMKEACRIFKEVTSVGTCGSYRVKILNTFSAGDQ